MKVIIIEDELPAAKRLAKLLVSCNDAINVIQTLDSVEASVRYLSDTPAVDLIFMDVQLADGVSFDIFEKVKNYRPGYFYNSFRSIHAESL